MADYKKPQKFIKKFEGEASKTKSDSASINCTSGCSGTFKRVTSDQWHTRLGVTWCTFNGWADKKNIPQSERCNRFINMTESDWLDIWKKGFWDKINGDEIRSQAIAEYWANAKWGNPSTANRFVAKALNKNGFNVDEDNVDEIVSAINSIKDKNQELKIFNDFVDARVAWLNSLSGASKNKGWFKRQESFRKRGRALIKSKDSAGYSALYKALGKFDSDFRTANSDSKDNTLILGIGILGVSLAALYLIDKKIKK
jgi:lysozyme family protein